MGNHAKDSKLLHYNVNIDRPEGGFTKQEKVAWQDELHRRLFPHKYDEDGVRVLE